MQNLQNPSSITHLHLLSIVNTLLDEKHNNSTIRILDAGCGNGKLISYLHSCLPLLRPNINFIISGFDVQDHGVQAQGFIQQTTERLKNLHPETDWGSRIHAIQANSKWEFATEKFDFIISNQVLEHVHDKAFFFSNVSAALVEDGHSIHLAPLKHVIHEGHIHLPWAHRITNFTALYGYIRLLSQLGLGKFKAHKKATRCTLDHYAERHADYIYFWTSYATESETLRLARSNGLRADFRFSTEFFTSKLMQLIGRAPTYKYRTRDYGFFDGVLIKLLRYLSSVTLVCKKANRY
jgi:SAM-dependent methyltransferase